MTAKKPEESGRAILLPALVETYAVVALLAAILAILWITEPAMEYADPAINILEQATTP